MKTLLRERLVECGWKDQIHMMCRQIVKERGVNIKVDELIAEITPKARGRIMDSSVVEQWLSEPRIMGLIPVTFQLI
uniref:Enhancer of yellow 2 transcription factor n=1 Tax=Timema poppense TaxID=170557 RepID=A0A7R9HI44_TIMPO|nr:unnamed protein product [Timema poppensis]